MSCWVLNSGTLLGTGNVDIGVHFRTFSVCAVCLEIVGIPPFWHEKRASGFLRKPSRRSQRDSNPRAAKREELELSFEAGEKLGLGPVETGDKVRSIIGHLALQVLNQVPVSGVFLTGGDTALGMLANIEADGSEILSEIRVGIPLVRVKGGSFEGLKLVTKAGAFGEDDAVAFALRKLKETI